MVLPQSEPSPESGYWGRQLYRRETSNGVVQTHQANAPPELVREHGHRNAHIVMVTQGAYVTSVTGENAFVARPVAVFNPPDMWHRDHFVGGRGSFITFDIAVEGLEDGRARHVFNPRILQHCIRTAAILRSGTQLDIEDALDPLARLFRETRPHEFAEIPGGIARAYQAIMESAEPWSLTVAELARVADVHTNHLPRAFRARFGAGASEIAARRQIEMCGAAIRSTEESLAGCAARFGFYDQAHMTGRFKKFTGRTPREWRIMSR